MHVNDVDGDYTCLLQGSTMTCYSVFTPANASDVLPPPKNYKDIHGRRLTKKKGAQLALRSSRAR
eukprot:687164-Pleurochrysis_carterae.AAC.1